MSAAHGMGRGILLAGAVGLSTVGWGLARAPGSALQAPEVVFDSRRDACDARDWPDVAVQALRLPSGSILMMAGNGWANRVLTGPGFDALARECSPVMVSTNDPRPETFANREWIQSVTRHGDTLYALVHNEYHDATMPGCLSGNATPANPCWYNSVTSAYSIDGGSTFLRLPPPAHLVAPPPVPWGPDLRPSADGLPRPIGYLNPSNVVVGPDGAWYAMLRATRPTESATGFSGSACLMRTDDLGDPTAWRAWDGAGFQHAFIDPYRSPASRASPWCHPVSPGALGAFQGPLRWHESSETWLMVGSWTPPNGACGFAISTSRDLVTWTAPRLVLAAAIPRPRANCAPVAGTPSGASDNYPSLLDHDSADPMFNAVGDSAWLYFVRRVGNRRLLLRTQIDLGDLLAP